MSVAGTAMNFNVTLLPCGTSNCTLEREEAMIDNSAITGVPLGTNQTNTTTESSGAGEHGPNLSVFVAIGTGLGVTGLCTMMLIGGMRKFREAP